MLSRREVVSHPDAKVIGLGGDPRILAIAARKGCGGRQRPLARLRHAVQRPYRDRSADRVLSSLVFHHLRQYDPLYFFAVFRGSSAGLT